MAHITLDFPQKKVFSLASRYPMEAKKGRWVLPNHIWNSTRPSLLAVFTVEALSKKGVAAHLQQAEAKHEHVAYLV